MGCEEEGDRGSVELSDWWCHYLSVRTLLSTGLEVIVPKFSFVHGTSGEMVEMARKQYIYEYLELPLKSGQGMLIYICQ